MDINNKDSLDSIRNILETSISSASINNKDSLLEIATKVDGAGDGFLNHLKQIADNLQLLDQNNHDSLDTIGKNIEQNGITNKDTADKMSAAIKDSSLSLEKVVSGLKSIEEGGKQSMGDFDISLRNSLVELEGSNKEALTA